MAGSSHTLERDFCHTSLPADFKFSESTKDEISEDDEDTGIFFETENGIKEVEKCYSQDFLPNQNDCELETKKKSSDNLCHLTTPPTEYSGSYALESKEQFGLPSSVEGNTSTEQRVKTDHIGEQENVQKYYKASPELSNRSPKLKNLKSTNLKSTTPKISGRGFNRIGIRESRGRGNTLKHLSKLRVSPIDEDVIEPKPNQNLTYLDFVNHNKPKGRHSRDNSKDSDDQNSCELVKEHKDINVVSGNQEGSLDEIVPQIKSIQTGESLQELQLSHLGSCPEWARDLSAIDSPLVLKSDTASTPQMRPKSQQRRRPASALESSLVNQKQLFEHPEIRIVASDRIGRTKPKRHELIQIESTKSHSDSDISCEASSLELDPRGPVLKQDKPARPKLRRIHTLASCAPLSRNVKTAPSTPEVENRGPPRHAESTSILEMSTPLSKRNTSNGNGITLHKSLDSSEARLHQKDVSQKMSKSRNDKFHKIFKNVPEKEVVLKSYLCAYVGDILLQGYLYISPNYFCFYTKILGHEKQLEIPVTDVVNVTREKTAFIIPNAIGVLTNKDKYVFGSLMSRDNTYKLMLNVLKKVNPGPSTSIKETDSDLSSEEQDDDDYFDAPDRHKIHHDLSEVDSATFSDCSDTSICTECGTPMAEHGAGAECDNSPNVVLDQDQIDGGKPSHRGSISDIKITKSRSQSLSSPHIPRSSFQGEAKWYNHLPCFGLSSKHDFFRKKIKGLKGMPKTNFMLMTSLVMAVFLIFSAALMTYKIMLLQEQLDAGTHWMDPTTSKYIHSQKLYSDLYYLNNRFHTSTIERFHSVLEANIQLLSQVHLSLYRLQDSPILTRPDCQSANTESAGNS